VAVAAGGVALQGYLPYRTSVRSVASGQPKPSLSGPAHVASWENPVAIMMPHA
jgi:hypothetical protein